jgi:hypothetical protein
MYATRDDVLVPSACLNSTVSGLVSRTVLRPDLLPAGSFHGAKYYAHLAPYDVSALFLDAIGEHLPSAVGPARERVKELAVQDRTPTWAGQATVLRLCARYGLRDANLVKPGIGETTRVLLRRVPWRVLVSSETSESVRHVLMLADERGVEIVVDRDLPYTCVGIIRP